MLILNVLCHNIINLLLTAVHTAAVSSKHGVPGKKKIKKNNGMHTKWVNCNS